MELWEILIPAILDNKLIKKQHHQVWDKFVREISGGLTILHFKTKGQWMCPQSHQLIEERMIPVRIACEAADIDKIIQFTLNHYQQEVVMAYQISNCVIMAKKKKPDDI